MASDDSGAGPRAAAARAIDVSTPPSGSGTATPSSAPITTQTLLTVSTSPGAAPTSTGIAVSVDLSSIGGSASQAFSDDGSNGDASPGDGVFSFTATIAQNTTPGTKSLPATISDAQGRSAMVNIALTVPTPTTLSGSGSASPGTVAPGDSTVFTVALTLGTLPNSTGVTVTADLSSIGGSATQVFGGSGTSYTYNATLNTGVAAGNKSIPFTVTDAQGRAANGNIALIVQLRATPPSGIAGATPETVTPGGNTTLMVGVTNGANPTSTGVTVTADLTPIGGNANQMFYDDGTHGDVTAGDEIFTFVATVDAATANGAKTILVTITDAQARTGGTTIGLTVDDTIFADGFDGQ